MEEAIGGCPCASINVLGFERLRVRWAGDARRAGAACAVKAFARWCEFAGRGYKMRIEPAKMQPKNWTDLSYLVALARAGRISEAAKRLKIDETTLSRHIAALEKTLGVRLFDRMNGTIALTEAGQRVAVRAERIEHEIDEIAREVAHSNARVSGVARVSAPPWMVSHILVPSLSALRKDHDALTVEILAEARNIDVMRREADIAVRMSRPTKEQRAVARRLGTLDYAVYGPKDSDARRLRWINFEAHMSGLPQSAWIADAMKREGSNQPALLVNDAAVALCAVQSGLGKTILPCLLGDGAKNVTRLGGRGPVLVRELWLMTHPDLKTLPRIRAVLDWLERSLVPRRRSKGSP